MSFHWVKQGVVAFGERPGRLHDVQQDLKWLRSQGIRSILSLVEEETWMETYTQAGFTIHHQPVDDCHAPKMDQMERCVEFIESNVPIYIHCMHGYGRSGTVAAAWLIHNGTPPIDAIRIIRKIRPGAIEVDEQFDALLEYGARIQTAETPGMPSKNSQS